MNQSETPPPNPAAAHTASPVATGAANGPSADCPPTYGANRQPVFKVLRADEWQLLADTGEFHGSADDKRDGFIHLSLAHQLAGTLRRHFAGEAALTLAVIDPERLSPPERLVYEVSSGGERYPHFYGTLCGTAVIAAIPLNGSLPDAEALLQLLPAAKTQGPLANGPSAASEPTAKGKVDKEAGGQTARPR